MSHRFRLAAVVVIASILVPGLAIGGGWVNPFAHCCGMCPGILPKCICVQPFGCPCTHQAIRPAPPIVVRPARPRWKAVRRPVVRYRDVATLSHRMEPYQQTVPVTVNQTVLVDEGRYEMVWVPRVVSRSIPRTILQQQTGWRVVPFATTQRLPEVHYETAWQADVPGVTIPPTAHIPTPQPIALGPPHRVTIPPTAQAGNPPPIALGPPHRVPRTPPPSVSLWQDSRTASGPVLDDGTSDWTPPRQSRRHSTARSTSGKFVPAPSAAAVWRSAGNLP